jgi:hypothetical protein
VYTVALYNSFFGLAPIFLRKFLDHLDTSYFVRIRSEIRPKKFFYKKKKSLNTPSVSVFGPIASTQQGVSLDWLQKFRRIFVPDFLMPPKNTWKTESVLSSKTRQNTVNSTPSLLISKKKKYTAVIVAVKIMIKAVAGSPRFVLEDSWFDCKCRTNVDCERLSF